MEIGNKKFNALFDIGHDDNILLKLSARLKADSFFYDIYNDQYKLLVSDSIDVSELKELKPSHVLLQRFNSIIIAIDNETSTLLNKDEFDENVNSEIYFENLISVVHKGLYHNDTINSSDIINVYPLDNSNLDVVLELYPTAKLIHFSTSLINFALNYQNEGVYAHVDGQSMNIIYVSDSSLKISKQVKINSAQDFLYFITMLFQEFDIDRNITPLILSGSIYPGSQMYNMIYDYIKTIEFPVMNRFSLAHMKQDIICSHYFDQYAILQCE